jgi:hypothetical protein
MEDVEEVKERWPEVESLKLRGGILSTLEPDGRSIRQPLVRMLAAAWNPSIGASLWRVANSKIGRTSPLLTFNFQL